MAGGDDDAFIVFKIQPSPTEDYIMDENQVAKPKPGKVAKVRKHCLTNVLGTRFVRRLYLNMVIYEHIFISFSFSYEHYSAITQKLIIFYHVKILDCLSITVMLWR